MAYLDQAMNPSICNQNPGRRLQEICSRPVEFTARAPLTDFLNPDAVSMSWLICTTLMPALRSPQQCSMIRTRRRRPTSPTLIPLTVITIEHEPEHLSLRLH